MTRLRGVEGVSNRNPLDLVDQDSEEDKSVKSVTPRIETMPVTRDEIDEGTKVIIRAHLISTREGVTTKQLSKFVKDYTGSFIGPIDQVEDILDSASDVCRPKGINMFGEKIWAAVGTSNTAHIETLIDHQKKTTSRIGKVKTTVVAPVRSKPEKSFVPLKYVPARYTGITRKPAKPLSDNHSPEGWGSSSAESSPKAIRSVKFNNGSRNYGRAPESPPKACRNSYAQPKPDRQSNYREPPNSREYNNNRDYPKNNQIENQQVQQKKDESLESLVNKMQLENAKVQLKKDSDVIRDSVFSIVMENGGSMNFDKLRCQFNKCFAISKLEVEWSSYKFFQLIGEYSGDFLIDGNFVSLLNPGKIVEVHKNIISHVYILSIGEQPD